MVEETPGRLEYEVALYKEAPPISRHSNHSVDLPVDQVTAVRSNYKHFFYNKHTLIQLLTKYETMIICVRSLRKTAVAIFPAM